MGERCDDELVAFENNECCFGQFPNLYEDGYPQCYSTEAEARGCKEIFYFQYSFNSNVVSIGEQRVIGAYCWPFDETKINADKDSVKLAVAFEFNLDQSETSYFIPYNERCLP